MLSCCLGPRWDQRSPESLPRKSVREYIDVRVEFAEEHCRGDWYLVPFYLDPVRRLSSARSSGLLHCVLQQPAPAANKHTQASRTSPHRVVTAPIRPTAPPTPPPAPPSAPSRAAEFPRPPWVPRGRWAPRARPFSRASCELIQCRHIKPRGVGSGSTEIWPLTGFWPGRMYIDGRRSLIPGYNGQKPLVKFSLPQATMVWI